MARIHYAINLRLRAGCPIGHLEGNRIEAHSRGLGRREESLLSNQAVKGSNPLNSRSGGDLDRLHQVFPATDRAYPTTKEKATVLTPPPVPIDTLDNPPPP